MAAWTICRRSSWKQWLRDCRSYPRTSAGFQRWSSKTKRVFWCSPAMRPPWLTRLTKSLATLRWPGDLDSWAMSERERFSRLRKMCGSCARCCRSDAVLARTVVATGLWPVARTQEDRPTGRWLHQLPNAIERVQVNMVRPTATQFRADQAHRIILSSGHQLRHALFGLLYARDLQQITAIRIGDAKFNVIAGQCEFVDGFAVIFAQFYV